MLRDHRKWVDHLTVERIGIVQPSSQPRRLDKPPASVWRLFCRGAGSISAAPRHWSDIACPRLLGFVIDGDWKAPSHMPKARAAPISRDRIVPFSVTIAYTEKVF